MMKRGSQSSIAFELRNLSAAILLTGLLVFSTDRTAVAADDDNIATSSANASAATPDYAQLINDHFGRGVKPSTNGFVQVYEAFGPHPENANLPAEFFRKLGIPAPPENGHYFQNQMVDDRAQYRQANDQLDRSMDRPWDEKTCPLVAEWLRKNEKPVSIVIRGTKNEHWFSPIVPGKTDDGKTEGLILTLLPAAQQLRGVARYLVARGMHNIQKGDIEAAWQDVLDCHRLGRQQAKGATLIDYLVGIAIQAIASDAQTKFIQYAQPDITMLARMQRDFAALPEVARPDDQLRVTEQYMLLDFIDVMEEGRMDVFELISNEQPPATLKLALPFVDWNVVRRKAIQVNKEMMAVMNTNDLLERSEKLEGFLATVRQRRDQLGDVLGSNFKQGSLSGALSGALADYLLGEYMPALGAVDGAATRAFAKQRQQVTLMALTMHRQRTGTYPESLQALVPSLLNSEPVDPFSRKPMHYKRTKDGFQLYCVGVNRKDDAGRSYGGKPAGDDIVLELPLKAETK